MADLPHEIGSILAGVPEECKVVDVFVVATILQDRYPEHSLVDLAKHVAEVAIEDGCRYLIWEPLKRCASNGE
jgi:hypothetical protein